MPGHLVHGVYRIISLTHGDHAAGLDRSYAAAKTVSLDEPVNEWVLSEFEDEDTYRLSVGGYPYTGVVDDRVTASIDREIQKHWHVTYRPIQQAYTIGPRDDTSLGWTVVREPDRRPEIMIKPFVCTKSLPPQYPPDQLYRLVPIEE